VHAHSTAAPGGGAAHLQSGIDICEQALLSRHGSTYDGWRDLGHPRPPRTSVHPTHAQAQRPGGHRWQTHLPPAPHPDTPAHTTTRFL